MILFVVFASDVKSLLKMFAPLIKKTLLVSKSNCCQRGDVKPKVAVAFKS